jgi:hypothetical protein
MPGIPFRTRLLLIKTETVYGTDAVPTAALNAFLANDVSIQPMEGQDVDRDLTLPYFGNTGTIPADLHAKISFKVEAEPFGVAGTPPAWAPALRACGFAQTVVAATSVTYNPITDNPESATIKFWLGNTLYAMLGSRGNVKLTYSKQGIPYLEFSFTGLFTVAAELVRPSGAVLSNFKKPKIAAKRHAGTFSLNGITALKLASLSLDLGNQVEPRLLINSEDILITGRSPKLDMVIEAEPTSTLNPYQLAMDQTAMALQWQHGTVAGSRFAVNVGVLQLMRPGSPADSQGIVEWSLSGTPIPTAGSDDFTFVLT